MSTIELSDVAEALEELLQHGTFRMDKTQVYVQFPLHVLDAFVSSLGFEARIVVKPSRDDGPRYSDNEPAGDGK